MKPLTAEIQAVRKWAYKPGPQLRREHKQQQFIGVAINNN